MSTRKNIVKRVIVILTAFTLVLSLLPATMTYAATNSKLTAKYFEYDNLRIKWSLVDDGMYYEIFRAGNSNGKAGKFKSQGSYHRNDENVPFHYDYSVEPGKTYYYKVRIFDANMHQIGETDTLKYTVKLETPYVSDVSTDIATGKPVIKWFKVDRASTYKVYRSTSKKGTYKCVKTTTSHTYKDTKTTSGKTYYYKVTAICNADKAGNSNSSPVYSAKAVKGDKKLAAAVKNTPKKKVFTLKNTISLVSKTDVRNLTFFDAFTHYRRGELKFSEIFNSDKIKAAGGALKTAEGGRGDPFFSAGPVYVQKNKVKYSPFEIKFYGVNIHKVKKNSTKKATIDSIKKTVNAYYPSKKWTVTVEKYDAKKHKGEIKEHFDVYNDYLQESGYGKYKSNKYVLKIKNKANSKKQGWTFVTAVPTL